MGIDEVTIRRTPRLILTNIGQQTVFDLLATRKESVVEAYLEKLANRHAVRVVAMDMWKPYKQAVNKALPMATIVVDKFHVLKMANACLDGYRKSRRAELSTSDRRRLMRHRHVLLKREDRLKDDERLKYQMWIAAFPDLGVMYRLKEEFYRIYDAKSKKAAKARYQEWVAKIPPDLAPYWKELTTAWKNWEKEILNFWDHLGVTNALTEGKNRIVREHDSRARGYSFEVLRAKVLYTHGYKKGKRPVYGYPEMPPDTFGMMIPVIVGYEPATFGVPISTFLRMLEEGEI